MNYENLTKLADFLILLPADYQHFEMSNFIVVNGVDNKLECNKVADLVNVCGSAGCAIGHGPAAGFDVPADLCTTKYMFDEKDNLLAEMSVVDWFPYADHFFCNTNESDEDMAAWHFMFDGEWSKVDNTPRGAAKRIRYVVENDGQTPAGFATWNDYDDYFDFNYNVNF